MSVWTIAPKGLLGLLCPGIMGLSRINGCAERATAVSPVCAGVLFYAASVTDPDMMFLVMLVNAMAFMPTIALSNSVSYLSCPGRA